MVWFASREGAHMYFVHLSKEPFSVGQSLAAARVREKVHLKKNPHKNLRPGCQLINSQIRGG